jgi:hypothetical protein
MSLSSFEMSVLISAAFSLPSCSSESTIPYEENVGMSKSRARGDDARTYADDLGDEVRDLLLLRRADADGRVQADLDGHDRLDGHVEVGDDLEHERLDLGRDVYVRRHLRVRRCAPRSAMRLVSKGIEQYTPIASSGVAMETSSALSAAMISAETSTVELAVRLVATGPAATRPTRARKKMEKSEAALKNCIVISAERANGDAGEGGRALERRVEC